MKDATEVKNLFNAKARTWNQKYRSGGALASRVAAFQDLLQRHLSANDKILDLGCGTGAIAATLAAGGFRVTACDVADEMIGAGKQQYCGSTIEWLLLPSDWKELPLDTASFDGIIASSVFEYLPDVSAVLSECQRILKPGGVLVATVPNPGTLIRKLENLLRPIATLTGEVPILNRIPKLRSYVTYLKCSRNRMPLDEWRAMGNRWHFMVTEEDSTRAATTALAVLVFEKTSNNSKTTMSNQRA